MSKLTKLRKLAKRASKGPWVEDDGNIFSKPQQEIELPLRMAARGYDSGVWDGLLAKCEQTLPNFDRDATFIAACDPQTITALLDAIEAATVATAAMRAYRDGMFASVNDHRLAAVNRAEAAFDAALAKLESTK